MSLYVSLIIITILALYGIALMVFASRLPPEKQEDIAEELSKWYNKNL